MDNLSIKKDDIVKARDNAGLIRKAALQVAKDFAEFSLEIIVPQDINMVYDDLFDQVKQIISNLLGKPNSILQALLYRIDLQEKDMKTATAAINRHTREIIITELILNRAMQKVMLREYFKQKGI